MIETYFIAAILVPLIFTLPGFVLLKLLKIKRKNFVELLSLSTIFSFILYGILGIVYHLSQIKLNIYLVAIPLLASVIFLLINYGLRRKRIRISKELLIILSIFILLYFVKIVLQIFIPFYPLGSDWLEHYKSSLVFFEKDWTFSIRPPFFNYLLAVPMLIFGKNLWVAQVTTVFVNSLFILPAYLIARKCFNKKIAILSFIFISINPLLIENALYLWPKNLVAFFMLFFFFLILEKRTNWILLGGIAGLSILTHQLSLFYILTGFVLLVMFYRLKFFFSKNVLLLAITILIFISPWLIHNIIYLGNISHSTFAYYPFAVDGYEKVVNATFSEVWDSFTSKPVYYIVGVRIVNFLNTFFPVIPLLKIFDIFSPIPVIYLHKIVDISTLPLSYHYFHSLPGNLTLLLTFFAYIGLFKLYKTKNIQLLMIIILPILLTGLFYGWIVPGLARQTLQPIIPLLILVGIWYVNSLKHRKFWFTAILALIIVESVIFAYSYYDYFISTQMFLNEVGALTEWLGQSSAYNIFFKSW